MFGMVCFRELYLLVPFGLWRHPLPCLSLAHTNICIHIGRNMHVGLLRHTRCAKPTYADAASRAFGRRSRHRSLGLRRLLRKARVKAKTVLHGSASMPSVAW